MHAIADVCEPCPSNGECYQGKLECLHGYRKHGRLCVEDGDINETAKQLVRSKNISHSECSGISRGYLDMLLNILYIFF